MQQNLTHTLSISFFGASKKKWKIITTKKSNRTITNFKQVLLAKCFNKNTFSSNEKSSSIGLTTFRRPSSHATIPRPFDGRDPVCARNEILNYSTAIFVMTSGPEQTDSLLHEASILKRLLWLQQILFDPVQQWYSHLPLENGKKTSSVIFAESSKTFWSPTITN